MLLKHLPTDFCDRKIQFPNRFDHFLDCFGGSLFATETLAHAIEIDDSGKPFPPTRQSSSGPPVAAREIPRDMDVKDWPHP
jgi:hypothetical protein